VSAGSGFSNLSGPLLAIGGSLHNVWRSAPLAPAAIAFTVGATADRVLAPQPWMVALALLAVITSAAFHAPGRPLWLLILVALVGAGRNGAAVSWTMEHDLASLLGDDPIPMRIEAVVLEGPDITPAGKTDPLRTSPLPPRYEAIVAVKKIWIAGEPTPASGTMHVSGSGMAPLIVPGDRIDAVGQAQLPQAPSNPGETDSREAWWARGVHGELRVADRSGDLVPLGPSNDWDLRILLSRVRRWASSRLAAAVDPTIEPLAAALLLGETNRLSRENWDQYRRTGVVHVLAISGQHLVLLALFLAMAGRVFGWRKTALAVPVACTVLIYAGMTGARPAALRAAATVGALAFADMLRRPRHLPSAIALSWIVVGLIDPGDLFSTGCLLSFLATMLLYWATTGWSAPPTEQEDALARARDMGRSLPWRWTRTVLLGIAGAYGANLVIWIGLAPMVAARTHLISPAALLVGPPLAILGSLALLPGFPLLLIGNSIPLVSAGLGWCVAMALGGCSYLVAWASTWPGGSLWVGDITIAWLVVWHLLLIPIIAAQGSAGRLRAATPALAWLALGLAIALAPPKRTDPWRCTFLSVGHGGCTVIEWADGTTTVYDAGSLAGPGMGRRVLVPFLWYRGIDKIDELILSHADLDHFNGVLDLVERIPVGKVITSSWFARKDQPGVHYVLDGLVRNNIPIEAVDAGNIVEHQGNSLEFLHPRHQFVATTQNEASVVVLLRSPAGSVLLTGDLEGAGQSSMLRLQPIPNVTVLQAPHHGGAAANNSAFLAWTRPWLIVAQQDGRRATASGPNGTGWWNTHTHGAITVRPTGNSIIAESFLTGQRLVHISR